MLFASREYLHVSFLCSDIGLSLSDCVNILKILEVSKSCRSTPRTALQVFTKERSSAAIMTFSEKLDIALGGGIHTGMLTEICGVPGVGKTQIW